MGLPVRGQNTRSQVCCNMLLRSRLAIPHPKKAAHTVAEPDSICIEPSRKEAVICGTCDCTTQPWKDVEGKAIKSR